MIDLDAEFAAAPLMLILRGLGPERSIDIAERAWDGGVGLVEVPLQTPRDAMVLRLLSERGRERGKSVGAGTVISPEVVSIARDAGAAFTVAPGLDQAILVASRAAEMPHIPGVATGSDLQRALSLACTWVKVFPASVLGPDWVRAMRGPFPNVRMVATGGVGAGNAKAFLDAGADAIAVGAALEDPLELARLTALTRANGI